MLDEADPEQALDLGEKERKARKFLLLERAANEKKVMQKLRRRSRPPLSLFSLFFSLSRFTHTPSLSKKKAKTAPDGLIGLAGGLIG